MHKFFYKFKADTHWELGFKMGEKFMEEVEKGLLRVEKENVTISKDEIKKSLGFTEKYFPQYIEELEGYAKGANVNFEKIWFLGLETDLFSEKCTSIITNQGEKFLHIEEGTYITKTEICLVKSKLKDFSKFEFFYYNTLGGNACGVNTNGLIFSINTAHHSDKSDGVPKNVIVRAVSDCSCLEEVEEILRKIPRRSGYSFNLLFLDLKNYAINNAVYIETSAKDYEVLPINTPYVHASHYLGRLQNIDICKFSKLKTAITSNNRFEFAKSVVKEDMPVQDLKHISDEIFQHTRQDLHNYDVDGRMIFDLEKKQVHVHLEREKATGWQAYNIMDVLNPNE